jgi:hypothetical protein
LDSPKFALLAQGLEESLEGRKEEARRTLASLRERLDVDADPEDMQYLIFSAALGKRLGEVPAEDYHLYLRRFELPQISLFNLLALRLPTVSLAGTIANELLADFIRGHDTVTLLDVGIGNGRQQVALLHSLALADALPRQLTLVGVEPSEDSLRAAQESLTAAARRLGVMLRFVGIPRGVEELKEEDWEQLEQLPGPRIVNAAFALHHIAERASSVDLRESFFQRLRRWSPAGVVLCEPNSDHHRVPIRQRFRNCWHHFGLTFKLIEELDTSRQEKNAMKLFFSREIEDIVGTQDEVRRYERHERVGAWLERLSRSGFTLAEGLARVASKGEELVAVRPYSGYVGLEYQDEALVSVICATAASKPV